MNDMSMNVKNMTWIELITSAEHMIANHYIDQAIALYQSWLEINTGSSVAYALYFNLGIILESIQNDTESEQSYRRSINLNSNFPQARFNLARQLEKQNRLEEALGQYCLILTGNDINTPDYKELHLSVLGGLGYLLEKVGRLQEAEKIFRKSLLIDLYQEAIGSHWISLRRTLNLSDDLNDLSDEDKDSIASIIRDGADIDNRKNHSTEVNVLHKPLNFHVIIATHCRAHLLARALDSLLQQTYPCARMTVISDALDDKTYRVVSERLRNNDLFLQRQGSPGPAASRNLGLEWIAGDFVLFLDDDDTYRPNFFATLAAAMTTAPKDMIYYTNFEIVNEIRKDDQWVEQDIIPIDLSDYPPDGVHIKNFIPNNCAVFPKQVVAATRFDSEIAYEDWDFLISSCTKKPLFHLPIFGPRVHKAVNLDSNVVHRGAENDSHLLDCYQRVYRKHPPLNTQIAEKRRELLSIA